MAISAVWYKPKKAPPGACLHALVIGVSHYSYLPKDGPGDERQFGLQQLTCAATSALAFAGWLKNDYRNPGAPLGSIRLLLSPSAKEKDVHPAGADWAGALRPDSTTVKKQLNAWKQDCEKNPDNVAILYVSGHGIILNSVADSILLLEDFGQADTNLLDGALDVGSIYRNFQSRKAPGRQYYFVDCCKARPDQASQYERAPVGVALDGAFDTVSKTSPVFCSCFPETTSYGIDGKGTIFSRAVVDCLQQYAVDPTFDGKWPVSVDSLEKSLEKRIRDLAQAHNVQQELHSGGCKLNAVTTFFHFMPSAPVAPMVFQVQPQAAAPVARGTVVNSKGPIFSDRKFKPTIEEAIMCGMYTIKVKTDAKSPYRKLVEQAFLVRPMGDTVTVEVKP